MSWWSEEPDDFEPAARIPNPAFEAAEVIAEAVYLLDGLAGEQLALAGHVIPGWAWLNALAHRTPDRLGELAWEAGGPGDGPWAAAVAVIGPWLADLSPSARHDIQGTFFVSLELGALAHVDWLADIERMAAGITGWRAGQDQPDPRRLP